MSDVAQHLVNAVSLGSLYALLALGIAVIFGVGRILNFAHGQLITVSAYVLLVVSGLPWPLVVVLTLLTGVVLALAMERFAFRHVRRADPATTLIVGFAVAALIQEILVLSVGARSKTVDFATSTTLPVDIAGISIPRLDLVTMGVTAVLLTGLTLLLTRTTVGIQLRAASEDFGMARLLGVRSTRIVATAFAISGLLAGTAAVLLTAKSGTLAPEMGTPAVLIGFFATVIGGMGSLPGAAVGGFVLGVVTVLMQVLLPDGLLPYRESLLFTCVIAMLLFRPQGILPAATAGQRV